ncbi:MAG: hypothetical protein QM775_30840 [Pirellulales bacterium]
MNTEQKWAYLAKLDDELGGGVMLSEWTCILVKDVDIAFCNHASLSAILAAQSAIECHLRFEFSGCLSGNRGGFYDLIEQSPLEPSMKADMHRLRRFRNRWVHVNDPADDEGVLARSESLEAETEEFAVFCMRLLRQTLYLFQCV